MEPAMRPGFRMQPAALRAIGALLVLIGHWAKLFPPEISRIITFIAPERIGFGIFLVISGYFITQVILQSKSKEPGKELKSFLSRRTWRLLPPYFVVVIATSLWLPQMAEHWYLHAFLVSNFYPVWHNANLPVGGHLWSVCVQMQIYLLWGTILFCTSYKNIRYWIAALWIMGPLSRFLIMYWANGGHYALGTFPAITFDWFAYGSLLAVLKHEGRLFFDSPAVKTIRRVSFFSLAVFLMIYETRNRMRLFSVIEMTLSALALGPLIVGAYDGVVRKAMNFSVFLWLGTISYSVYLVHPFVPEATRAITNFYDPTLIFDNSVVLFAVNFAVVLLLAAALYYTVELPLRRYARSRAGGPSTE